MVKEKEYIDVTKEWLKNKTDDGAIINAKYIIINNQKFYVNKVNKINHKNNEIKIAILTVITFGGILEFLPDIGEKSKYRCGDYFYKNEVWDAKEIGKNARSQTRAVDNLLKMSKGQANNFILDISNCNLKKQNILKQIKKIYSTKNRNWIDKIIVFRNEKLIKVYKRNKRD